MKKQTLYHWANTIYVEPKEVEEDLQPLIDIITGANLTEDSTVQNNIEKNDPNTGSTIDNTTKVEEVKMVKPQAKKKKRVYKRKNVTIKKNGSKESN